MVQNVLEYLEATACRVPERTAYADERKTVTYAELLDQAKRVGSAAAQLAAPKQPIAVLMDTRDTRCVIALLGVLYAGCFFVPLDADMPAERLQLILGQLEPALLLCDEKGTAAVSMAQTDYPVLDYQKASETAADDNLLQRIRAGASIDDVMSIMYTSGSTGIPKGVMQSQRSHIYYTEATILKYNFAENTVFGNQSPFFYANSIIDIYPPIALGATTYILPAKALSFPKYLIEQLNEYRVAELTMTPSSYVKVANAGVLSEGTLPYLQYIILSGEAASWATLRQWMAAAPNADVWNFYGSTEAYSVAVLRIDREFSDGDVIPVGLPYKEVEILFLDDEGTPVAPGERGEMLIHNPWLSDGYYRDAARTDGVFVLHDGKRYYRTGDYGFLNDQGQLVVLGRQDQQIKHMGYRMELGEVEYALRTLPGWQDGCCLFKKDSGMIYCFWTGNLSKGDILAGLKKILPKYALPDVFINLPQLPHTATMKIDRQKLRADFMRD